MIIKNISILSLTVLFISPCVSADTDVHLYVPEDVQKTAGIQNRQSTQLKTSPSLRVPHSFRFVEQREKSGIDFVHRIVDDAGKYYKAVHYDHGNGVAVADINGDDLLDIYFVSQAGPNGLYLNLGNGQFKNITRSSGTALENVIGVSASFADIDNDGDPDLYVTNVKSPNVLFENIGGGKFRDISQFSQLDYNEHSSSATFFDFNRDGYLDLFLAVVGEYTTDQLARVEGTVESEKASTESHYYVGRKDAFAGHLHKSRQRLSRLFVNLGNKKFMDVTREMELADVGWTGDATPVDFNQDGWIDLYVLNMQGPDHYWVNENGKKFTEQTQSLFPATPWGAMGVKSFDYNNDGLLDLMISDMHSDMSEKIGPDREKFKADWITENWTLGFLQDEGKSIYGNALFQQHKDGSFTEVSDLMNVENYWPWGLTVADINADGWQDIFLTSSMNYPFRYAPNSMLLNNQGKQFIDSEYILGLEPREHQHTDKPWFELDCHDKDKSHPICKQQDQHVVVHGALGSRSSAIFDLDEDGDLDIVTNEFGDLPQVLISNLNSADNTVHFLKIELHGKQSNRNAFGARVTVMTKENTYTKVHDGKSGYLSQSVMPLYFGLAQEDDIESIDILWPSGQRQTIAGEGIAINQLLKFDEPAQ